MIEPAWVLAGVAAGGVVADHATAPVATTRIQGMEDRLREAEQAIAVLEAVCAKHRSEVGHDG